MVSESPLASAIAAHRVGNLSLAESLYRSALAENPRDGDAWALLGVALSACGRHEEAVDAVRRAVEADPLSALFRFYFANVLAESGDREKAVTEYREAVRLKPDFSEAHYNLGNALKALERCDEAEAAWRRTTGLSPAHAEAANNLALMRERAGDLSAAAAELRRAVAIRPDYAEGWINLCGLLEKSGDFAAALDAAMQATALAPRNAAAWQGLGVALNRLERHDEAMVAYKRALAIEPERADLWDNLGQTCQYMNRLDDAEKAFRKAVSVAGQEIPDEDSRHVPEKEYGNRHWHLALLELLKGDYKRGFARYRSRFGEVEGLRRRDLGAPPWNGEEIRGKTILVYDEQGMGDCLMLCRYLQLLRERGAVVKFLVQPALEPLFRHWEGADNVISRAATKQDAAAAIGGFDFHASVFDLPYCFGTSLATVPDRVPYLPTPKPMAIPESGGFKRRVGVAWAGAPKHKHDAARSIPLRDFSALFSVKGIDFFSFNRDMREGDAEILSRCGVTDLSPRISDFMDAAKFMAAMDLIVTCDTATAHLAGGMGRRVWTLLPFSPDWRWMTERAHTPWYPTMTLFRQPKSGDWAAVMAKVIEGCGG